MAKKYTRAQWERMQSSFLEEDRIPYEMSPDKNTTKDVGSQQAAEAKQSVTEQITGLEQGTGRDSRRAIAPSPTMTTPELEINRDSRRAASPSPILTDTAEYRAGERGYQAVQPTGPTGGTGPAGGSTGPTGGTGPAGAGGDGEPVVTYTASDGTKFTDRDIYLEYEASLRGQRAERQSAFDLLYGEFSRYGLGSLVETLRGLITDSSVSPSEFSIRLRQSEPYKKRFAANSARITKGLRALTEAEYMELEDSYQDIMRRYGLPETYYTKSELGRQQGFEDLIGFDISPRELEERIATAQERVKNAPPEVLESIKSYYGDAIRDGDVLAYVLDPKNAVDAIKRKVAAAEIGAGARQAGLGVTRERAEELGRYGVTGEKAQAGFQQIAGGLERGGQLAAIYQQAPYGQEVAEQEIFGLAGATEARKRRQKIIKSEEAAFGGQTGLTGGALARERAGQI